MIVSGIAGREDDLEVREGGGGGGGDRMAPPSSPAVNKDLLLLVGFLVSIRGRVAKLGLVDDLARCVVSSCEGLRFVSSLCLSLKMDSSVAAGLVVPEEGRMGKVGAELFFPKPGKATPPRIGVERRAFSVCCCVGLTGKSGLLSRAGLLGRCTSMVKFLGWIGGGLEALRSFVAAAAALFSCAGLGLREGAVLLLVLLLMLLMAAGGAE